MAVLCRIYGSNTYSNIYVTYDTDGDSEPGKYTSGLYLRNGCAGMEYDASGTETMNIIHGYAGGAASNMYFKFGAGTRMTLNDAGHLGMGVTPCGAIDAYEAGSGGASGTGDNLIVRGGNNSSTFTGNQIRFGYNGGIGYSHVIKSRHQSASNYQNALDFFIWNTTNCVETAGTKLVMTLDGTGNVGMGTCSPAGKLHISHTSSEGACAIIIQSTNSCGNGTIAWRSSEGTTQAQIGSNYNVGDVAGNLEFITTASTRLLITSAGCVGVGTSSPTYKLHVNGTFYAAGSSQDYKQSICNYNTDSCMFMKLKPVTYQYKEEYCHLGKELKSGTQIGLIAEEVAESHPELAILVNEEDEKVVRNVDYEKLTIILLSELQKLRQEVDQLKNK